MTQETEARTLWNREFRLVDRGLDQDQIIEFVDELTAKLEEAQQRGEKASYPRSLERLAEQTLMEAERLADEIKENADQAKAQAQVEADRTIEEAQAKAREESESVAKAAAEEAQMALDAAREKSASVEAESKRQAKRLIELTMTRVDSQYLKEVKGASEKLLGQIDGFATEMRALGDKLEDWDMTISGEGLASEMDGTDSASPSVDEETPDSSGNGAGDGSLNEGPVQVVIQAPVYTVGMGEVYNRLVQIQDVTMRDTQKEDDGSYVITLSLGQPTPLLDILKVLEKVDEVNIESTGIGVNGGDGGENGQDPAPATSFMVTLNG